MTDMTDKQLLQAIFEEVGTVKEKLTELEMGQNGIKREVDGMKGKIGGLREEVNDLREETSDKLDKILGVVSQRLSTQDKKIKRIENHLGMPALV